MAQPSRWIMRYPITKSRLVHGKFSTTKNTHHHVHIDQITKEISQQTTQTTKAYINKIAPATKNKEENKFSVNLIARETMLHILEQQQLRDVHTQYKKVSIDPTNNKVSVIIRKKNREWILSDTCMPLVFHLFHQHG